MDIITQWDMAALVWVREYLNWDALDPIMIFITNLGNDGLVWLSLAAVLLCFRRTRRAGICVLTAMLICLLVGNLGLKNWVARVRPYHAMEGWEVAIPHPNGFSFPSGHTMHALGAATAILLCNRKLGTAAMVLAIMIAFTRIYLGVHYPTDVMAGMVLGAAAAMLSCAAVNRIWKKEVPVRE